MNQTYAGPGRTLRPAAAANSTLPTRSQELREALAERVLVTDGAMGTMLYSKGAFINRCYDELNLSLPALVRDVHQEYVRAGAEIIETNTFGANRKRLQPFGFADKVRAINHAGVRIAREAADKAPVKAFVAGAVGPLGARLAPLGHIRPEEARAIFREQIAALVEAGIDLLMFETFRDLNELREAVAAAREAGGEELIVGALLSIEDDGRLENGASPEDFTRALNQMPIEIVGLNCSSGPRIMLETIEKMAAHTSKILCAMPNAGLPADRGWPQYLSVLARVHGAVLAPVPRSRGEDCGRMLWIDPRAHQGNSQGSPAASSREALTSTAPSA